MPPNTVPIDGDFMAHLAQVGLASQSIGFDTMDRSVHLDTMIERVIGRWKAVVQQARGGGGMAAQRSLSGDSTSPLPPALPSSNSNPITTSTTNTLVDTQQTQSQTPTIDVSMEPHQPERTSTNTDSAVTDLTMDVGSDADADADADMEEDESFVDMSEAPPAANFRLANTGNPGGNGAQRINGMGEVVQGYVRIGA